MSARLSVFIFVVIVCWFGIWSPASASPPCTGETTFGGAVFECEVHSDMSQVDGVDRASTGGLNGEITETVIVPGCSDNRPDQTAWDDQCLLFHSCTSSDDRFFSIWQRGVRYSGGVRVWEGDWIFSSTACLSVGSDEGPRPVPAITWEMVLNEIKRVGLPALAIRVQPADRTLVNFETIFYTEPEPFERQLTLLGQRVDVRATVTSFAWSFGDGETLETATAGAPYPAKDIVHEYVDADVTVAPKVDVTYTAQFRVNGGSWQEIPETVTIGGPSTSLDVLEATPVLVSPG
jgi:hypothetical protein